MQRLIGRVIRSAAEKTAKVSVDRVVKDKKYLKAYKISKNYTVHDENNSASVGDIVEIVYHEICDPVKCFKINQTLKFAEKFVNPINGCPGTMVLPWISDRTIPAFKKGLLSCPFYDNKDERIRFAVDQQYALNLKQTCFYTLQKPPYTSNTELGFAQMPSSNSVSNLRKMQPEIYVTTPLVSYVLDEPEYSCPGNNFKNKLALINNPSKSGQHIAIYPSLSRTDINFQFLNEFDLETDNVMLCSIDKYNIHFDSPIREIRATENGTVAVSSSQIIKTFCHSNEGILESINCIAPPENSFGAFDIHKTFLQISSILCKSNILQVFSDYSKQEHEICSSFKNCSYSLHPSLIFLSGTCERVEVKDFRCAFPGLSISDRHVPIDNVLAMIQHSHDDNLLALSCEVNSSFSASNLSHQNSELRIYDLRYPKESIMRIASDLPIQNFLSYGSFISENYDHIFGIDSRYNCFYWEFNHSSSNSESSDGLISMSDSSKVFEEKDLPCSDQNFQGYSITSSNGSTRKLIYSRLSTEGELDFCNFSASSVSNTESLCDYNFDISDSYSNASTCIRNFASIYEANREANLNDAPIPPSALEFDGLAQSAFHLDFYWDEIKANLLKTWQNK